MNQLMEDISVIDTFEYKGVFDAVLYNNTIIEVKWNHELKEIEKQHIIALTNAIKKLGKGKKMRVYITTFDFMTINEESRKYSSTLEAEQFTLANAVLIDSLAKKILFNFYLKFNKPNVPTRAFQLKKQAFEWLLTIKD